MKKITMAFAALSLLFAACEREGGGTEAATLEIDAPSEITFNADGTGGRASIAVTTNQSEWDYAMSPTDGAGWLTALKDEGVLKLTAAPNTSGVEPASVTITFRAGDAPEKTTTAKQLAVEVPPVEGYRVDDLWPDNDHPEGIVFWIDPASSNDGGVTGTSGWVMGLRQADPRSWSSHNIERDYGTNSDIDGRLNMEAVAAYEAENAEYRDRFPVFAWCRSEYGEEWYIPSLQEMRQFFAAYAGLTPEQTTTYMNGRRQFSLDQTFGAGTFYGTEEHRRAYDMALEHAGGDGLWDWLPEGGSNDPQLWTSTKYDEHLPNPERQPWYSGFLGDWGSSSTHEQQEGHFLRAMRRFGDIDRERDELSVDQTSISFEAVDASAKIVNLTKTAAEYGATTAPVAFAAPWINIAKSADSFTVTVEEYTEAEAYFYDYMPRQGYITVVAGYAPAATIHVMQSAPPRPAVNLAGTWNWTGEIWNSYNPIWTAMSGTVTAEYNAESECYIFKTLLENQAMTGMMNPDDRVDGGIAVRVTEDNRARFVVQDRIGIYYDLWGMGMFRGYFNYASLFNANGNNVVKPVASGLPAETSLSIDMDSEGTVLTFQKTGVYTDPDSGESIDCDYGFGFGYIDVVSMEDHTISPTASPIQPAGIYRNLVFTKVQ